MSETLKLEVKSSWNFLFFSEKCFNFYLFEICKFPKFHKEKEKTFQLVDSTRGQKKFFQASVQHVSSFSSESKFFKGNSIYGSSSLTPWSRSG